MAQTMTPSKAITDGQIDKAVELYRAMLKKHKAELGSEAVQQVLGQPDYVAELVAVLRRRAEAVSDVIIRSASVNRTRTPQEAIKVTGRAQYVVSGVVDSMPRGEGEIVEIVFFKVSRYVNDNDLEKEYELRGLKPVDPYSLAAVNEADPTFADDHPNATHRKDSSGKWCYAAFRRWRGRERRVSVDGHVGWLG